MLPIIISILVLGSRHELVSELRGCSRLKVGKKPAAFIVERTHLKSGCWYDIAHWYYVSTTMGYYFLRKACE